MLAQATTPLLARGVYQCPWLSTAGEVVLVAIDRRGRRLGERTVPLDGDLDGAWAGALAWLDHEDPPMRDLIRVLRSG